MITLEVKDMSCGHCVSAINNAVLAADGNATVQIDLATKRVQLQPASADTAVLMAAIEGAGYTPVLIELGSVAVSPSSGGCCRNRT
jgi:copper chaperone